MHHQLVCCILPAVFLIVIHGQDVSIQRPNLLDNAFMTRVDSNGKISAMGTDHISGDRFMGNGKNQQSTFNGFDGSRIRRKRAIHTQISSANSGQRRVTFSDGSSISVPESSVNVVQPLYTSLQNLGSSNAISHLQIMGQAVPSDLITPSQFIAQAIPANVISPSQFMAQAAASDVISPSQFMAQAIPADVVRHEEVIQRITPGNAPSNTIVISGGNGADASQGGAHGSVMVQSLSNGQTNVRFGTGGQSSIFNLGK